MVRGFESHPFFFDKTLLSWRKENALDLKFNDWLIGGGKGKCINLMTEC